jgi:hypothetical protein
MPVCVNKTGQNEGLKPVLIQSEPRRLQARAANLAAFPERDAVLARYGITANASRY